MPLPGYGLVKQKKIPEALDLGLSYHTCRNDDVDPSPLTNFNTSGGGLGCAFLVFV